MVSFRPINVLSSTYHPLFSLLSFLRITTIWSPLSDYMTCTLRRMKATVAIGLKLGVILT